MLKYKTKGNKRGFTLVELVIVIAVIAILAAVLIPTFTNIIESANNSADTQLVANMNTVLSTDVYANQTATGTNLRKLLKDNGITDLTTRNKDNIIVYNQVKERFEKINLKEVKIQTEEEQKNKSLMADDETLTLTIDPDPFSFDEIFQGYTIVSTGGNDFAEAIYKCLTYKYTASKGEPKMEDGLNWFCNSYPDENIKKAFTDSFKKLIGSSLGGASEKVSGTAAFVVKSSGAVILQKYFMDFKTTMTSGEYGDFRYLVTDKSWTSAEKVLINEEITKLDLAIFNGKGMTVVLPNTVESVEITNSETTDLSKALFVGNVQVLHNYAKPLTNDKITEADVLCGAQIGTTNITETKKAIKEFGSLIHETEFYLVKTDHTDAKKEHYYTDINAALQDVSNSAKYSGQNRDLVVAGEYEISGEVNIPAGVTLQVPYYSEGSKFYTGYGAGSNAATGRLASEQGIVDDDYEAIKSNYTKDTTGYKKFTLNIAEGATLTVEKGGGLVVGGVLSHLESQNYIMVGYQGHTSGYYGQINNKGSIIVADGGKLESNGYIKCEGKGTVTAAKGSTVIEPLVLTDFRDPMAAFACVFQQGTSPFYGYSVMNINNLLVKAGAVVKIRIAIALGSSTVYEEDTLIGYDLGDSKTDDGLIILKDTESSVKLEYSYNTTDEGKKAIQDNTNTAMNLKGDIGVTKMTFSGEIDTGFIRIKDTIPTNSALFPISYNYEYVIDRGCTFNVYNRFVVLPGAEVTVNAGGTLNVTNGAQFYVADCFRQAANQTKYPTAEQLTTAGYSASGVLTINGTMNVAAGAYVGGIVRSTAVGATLTVDTSANVAGQFIEGGVVPAQISVGGIQVDENSGTSLCNASVYISPLRILLGSTLTNVTSGKTYKSTGDSTTKQVSVTMAYLANNTDQHDEKDTKIDDTKDDAYVQYFETQRTSVLTGEAKTLYDSYSWYKKTATISVETLGWTEQPVSE